MPHQAAGHHATQHEIDERGVFGEEILDFGHSA
jgi:hypothetical protein